MTREEAIKVLESMKSEESHKALIDLCDMAIEALSATNTEKLSSCGDLISRADAIEHFNEIADEENTDFALRMYLVGVVNDIKKLPSVDAVSRKSLNDLKFITIKGDKAEEAYRSGWNGAIECIIENAPSADAVQGYTEWLEKIIVEAETFEWLCENATDKEWCEKNCNYASIQAECLRHLYEVNKGGDD